MWLLSFQHWLAVHTGSTAIPIGPYYNFWSGFGSDIGEITIITGLVAIYKKNNCQVRRCLSFGHHDWVDPDTSVIYRVCRLHHPDHPGKKPLLHKHIIEKSMKGNTDGAYASSSTTSHSS